MSSCFEDDDSLQDSGKSSIFERKKNREDKRSKSKYTILA